MHDSGKKKYTARGASRVRRRSSNVDVPLEQTATDADTLVSPPAFASQLSTADQEDRSLSKGRTLAKRVTGKEKREVARPARARRQRHRRRRDRAMAAARKKLVKQVAELGKGGRWQEAFVTVDAAIAEGLTPDLYVYSSCVGAVARSGRWREALDILRKMRVAGFNPNTAVYNAAIHACGVGGRWEVTLRLLGEMRGCADLLPVSALKSGQEQEGRDEYCGAAGNIFDNFDVSSKAVKKQQEKAAAAVGGSGGNGVEENRAEPDIQTFNTVMSACGRAGEWQLALDVMQAIREWGLLPNRVTYNTAISACGKGGQPDAALGLLEDMRQTESGPDAFSYNSAISACASTGRWENALTLLGEMKSAHCVTPDKFSFSSAIAACGKGGQWKLALGVLEAMKRAGIRPGRVAFNAAIEACAGSGQWKKAIYLLREMEEEAATMAAAAMTEARQNGGKPAATAVDAASDVAPDVVSYNSALKACVDAGEWRLAVSLLEEMQRGGRELAGRAGNSNRAMGKPRLRSPVPAPNVVSYSMTIAACGRAGVSDRAMGLLKRMRDDGFAPTPATFTAAITACRKGGQARLVLTLLDRMRAYGVKPDPICYGAALCSCGEAMLCEPALKLVAEMAAAGVEVDNSARRAVAVACAESETRRGLGDGGKDDDRGGETNRRGVRLKSSCREQGVKRV